MDFIANNTRKFKIKKKKILGLQTFGDRSNPNNNWGISLFCTAYTVYAQTG